MAEYIYIENLQGHGKLGISRLCFDRITRHALSSIPDIAMSKSRLSKNQNVALNRPIRTSIHNQIAYIHLALDVKKDADVKKLKKDIQDKIHTVFEGVTEQVHYEIDLVITSRF